MLFTSTKIKLCWFFALRCMFWNSIQLLLLQPHAYKLVRNSTLRIEKYDEINWAEFCFIQKTRMSCIRLDASARGDPLKVWRIQVFGSIYFAIKCVMNAPCYLIWCFLYSTIFGANKKFILKLNEIIKK